MLEQLGRLGVAAPQELNLVGVGFGLGLALGLALGLGLGLGLGSGLGHIVDLGCGDGVEHGADELPRGEEDAGRAHLAWGYSPVTAWLHGVAARTLRVAAGVAARCPPAAPPSDAPGSAPVAQEEGCTRQLGAGTGVPPQPHFGIYTALACVSHVAGLRLSGPEGSSPEHADGPLVRRLAVTAGPCRPAGPHGPSSGWRGRGHGLLQASAPAVSRCVHAPCAGGGCG